MESQKPQEYSAVIIQKKQLTKQIYHLFFQLESPSELRFIPGQYATFIIDQTTRRQYSICSDPHDVHNIEIVIDTTPMGPGSKYFIESNVGERVSFLAPLGNFHLEETPTKKVLVATGTGIAPFRSMLLNEVLRSSFLVPSKEYDELSFTTKELTKNKELTTRNFSLYWGLRHEDDIYWDKEFEDLRGQLAGFQYFLCLSKPSEDWENSTLPSPRLRRAKGHVTEHVMENEKNPENCEFYLCGNKNMIQEMTARLSAKNVKKEQIKSDLFY